MNKGVQMRFGGQQKDNISLFVLAGGACPTPHAPKCQIRQYKSSALCTVRVLPLVTG